jgi:putative DNA primase/helicase
MQTNQLDFKGLANELLSRSLEIVSGLLPGGKVRGREYVCSGLSGGNGDSMSVNLSTGRWSDFANSDCAGGDLISLRAAVEGISNGEAYKRFSEEQGFQPMDRPELPPPPPPAPEVCQPPEDAPVCEFTHHLYGDPTSFWSYLDTDGKLLFYVVRYDLPDGKKQILPFCWSVDGKWVNKGYPSPRPLYNLNFLSKFPDKPVLLCEGEKAADAASQLMGAYVAMTWSNGSNAYKKADWSPIYGRKILLWPDADQVGIDAMQGIAALLKKHCPEIKILTPTGMADGFDAADALEQGWTKESTKDWARSCVSTYHTTAVAKPLPVVAQIVHAENANVIAKEAHIHEAPEDTAALTETAAYWVDALGLPVTQKGTPLVNVDCATRALEAYPPWKDMIWFDVFEQKIFTTYRMPPGSEPREWTDVDTIEMQIFMQRTFGISKMPKETLYDALVAVGYRRTRNGPKEYFESLTWDGVPRINNFLSSHMSADTSEYTEAVSKNFWIAMAARVYRPGCKMDNMMMLEGSQGKYKSTTLGVIGGKWFAEAHGQVTDANFYYNIQGKLLIEFAELDAVSKAEASAIKKFASCPTDRYRPVWGRSAKDFPRQCICIGTTNEEEYLKDNSGARRFWPVKTHTIYIDKVRADRDQLFAEAVARYKAGESWWEVPKEAADEQEKRRMTDEWESMIADYLKYKEQVRLSDVAIECLMMPPSKIGHLEQRRIGKALSLLGWQKFQVTINGARVMVWRNRKYYSEPDA